MTHKNKIISCSSGFALIEILVAIVIASTLGIVLFSSLGQITQTAGRIEGFIDQHEKLAVALGVLERDIAGAFSPAQPPHDKKASSEQPTKKMPKQITHIFYGTKQENGQLQQLTFITDNPLQVYWSSSAGGAVPRIARIVYRLVPDQSKKKFVKKGVTSYALLRQEAPTVYYDAFSQDAQDKIRSYELIDGIQSMTIKYGVHVPKEKKEPSTKNPEMVYQVSSEWNKERTQGDEKKESSDRKVPDDVEIILAVWDTRHERSTSVTLTVALVPETEEVVSKKGAAAVKQGTAGYQQPVEKSS
jgi:type II secretory pathway component PulJ